MDPATEVDPATINLAETGPGRAEADLRGSLQNPDEADAANDNAAEDADAEAEEPQDYQLSRALDLLRGLSLYRDRVVAN